MVLWQSELRVSWRAQWLSLLLHGAVMLALLLAPWPSHFTLVWLILLMLVVLEAIGSQRRIRSRTGAVVLLSEQELRWRGRQWRIVRRPWMGQQSIFLSLRAETGSRERLWLMRDSVPEGDWRQLCQQLSGNGR